MSKQSIVVFDLGGVLVDWDPRYLFMKMKRPEGVTEDIEWFLGHVCTQAWNEQMDEGLPFREGLAQLSPQFPAWRDWIEAYHARWVEMLGGEIGGTVEILNRLSARGVPLYALSNWSAETFPIARARYDFFRHFRGIVLSGEVKLKKPDLRIYRHLLTTHGLEADRCVYIDDVARNVEAARTLGFHGHLFRDPPALARELASLGLL